MTLTKAEIGEYYRDRMMQAWNKHYMDCYSAPYNQFKGIDDCNAVVIRNLRSAFVLAAYGEEAQKHFLDESQRLGR